MTANSAAYAGDRMVDATPDVRPLSLSVIVPAYQASASLARCLDALAGSTVTPAEIVVVDDGSTDGTAMIARRSGAVVLSVPDGPRGPAAARNIAAAGAKGDILVFLDADVAIHADALGTFADLFERHAELAAAFGSYDDAPEHPAVVSQYRNLLHHFVHQQGQRRASTFWAGCGAIRRAVFADIGGFDERYRRASIEDIELGGRLREAGHEIWLCPQIQAAHLKRWTLTEIVRSDIVDRAVPWSRLIGRRRHMPPDLNVSVRHRVGAVAAWLMVFSAGAALIDRRAWWIAAAAFCLLVLLNAGLYRMFWRKGGGRLTLAGVALHTVHVLYSSVVFAVVAPWAWLTRSANR